jgi:hypothetical protein
MWPVFPNRVAIQRLTDKIAIFTRGKTGCTVRIKTRNESGGFNEQRFLNGVQALIHLCAITKQSISGRMYDEELPEFRAHWRSKAIESTTDVAEEHCNAIRHLETIVEAVDLSPYGGPMCPVGTRLTDIFLKLCDIEPDARTGSLLDPKDYENLYETRLLADRKSFFKSIKGRLFQTYKNVLDTGKLPPLQARIAAAASSPIPWPTAPEVNTAINDAEIVDLLYCGPPEAGGVAPHEGVDALKKTAGIIKRINTALEDADGKLPEELEEDREGAIISPDAIATYRVKNAARARESIAEEAARIERQSKSSATATATVRSRAAKSRAVRSSAPPASRLGFNVVAPGGPDREAIVSMVALPEAAAAPSRFSMATAPASAALSRFSMGAAATSAAPSRFSMATAPASVALSRFSMGAAPARATPLSREEHLLALAAGSPPPHLRGGKQRKTRHCKIRKASHIVSRKLAGKAQRHTQRRRKSNK